MDVKRGDQMVTDRRGWGTIGKYCGTVTDQSWYTAVFRSSAILKYKYLNERGVEREKFDEGFDFVYKLGRLPRIYWDEV